MDIHFGRVKEKDKKVTIQPINNNKQAEEGVNILYEEDARKMYRKWDNVKHIAEELKENARPRKVYGSGLWGLSIKTKERMQNKALYLHMNLNLWHYDSLLINRTRHSHFLYL